MDARAVLHPTDQALGDFGLGRLDDASAWSVRRHLEGCADCRRRVAELSGDSFLGRLRETQGTNPSSSHSARHAPPQAETLPAELVHHPDYEIVRELGRGGMGVVYLAQNRLMGRLEVLKVVGRHLIERPGVLDRFLREIRSAARLKHPNIVTAYSAMRLGAGLMLAMEYVEGLDLARMVKAKGPLPVSHACNFVHQAALGLQHAHERGMVHRDIKPANLILAREGKRAVVKVLDFGLAKVGSEGQADGGLTREGQMLGTPDYIAPEQIRDAQSADIRADIYSLGCTLYYLLSGGPPFRGAKVWDVYQAHFSMEADALDLVRPEVPAELAALVAKMLAKEPGERFQAPGEVARELTRFFKPATTHPPGSGVEVTRDDPRVAPTQLSGVGPAPKPPSTPAKQEPSRPKAEGAAWESLIEFKETERSAGAAKPEAATGAWVRRPRSPWPPVAAGMLLSALVVAWAAGVFTLKTEEGDLVFSNLPEQAVVTVDGKTCTVEWPGGKGPAKITAPRGRRMVKVELGGIQVFGEEVSVETGKAQWISVRLEPPAASRPRGEVAQATPAESISNGESSSPSRVGDVAWPGWKGDPVYWHSHEGTLDGFCAIGRGQPHSYLYSEKSYKDFELRCRLRLRGGTGNSGIQIRSELVDPRRFLVRGPQADIGDRYWGSLYGEDFPPSRGRMMQAAPADLVARIVRPDDFNDFAITCVGKHLTIAINGTTTIDGDFPQLPDEGRIAWQLHSGEPVNITIKDLEIKELPAEPQPGGFRRLFNGKDLEGWSSWGSQGPAEVAVNWWVRDGILHGSGTLSHLFSPRGDYKDFRVRAEVKINAGGNSGLYFRAAKGSQFPDGYEAQINSTGTDPNRTGSLYRRPSPPISISPSPVPPDTWFTLEAEAVGNRIRVWVDGKSYVDWTDPEETYRQGHIAIQVHDPQTHVQVRKLEVVGLDRTGKAIAGLPAEASYARPLVDRSREGFLSLFNGKDLAGWTIDSGILNTWRVEGGDLVVTGQGDWRKSGFVLNDRDFSSFHLRFEFLPSPGSNSGVTFWAKPGEFAGRLAYPLQVELFDRERSDIQNASFIWSTSHSSRDMMRPGRPARMNPGRSWNTMELEVQGDSFRVSINGKEVLLTDLRMLARRPGANPALMRRSGCVGFQAHTGTVRFRNIEIKDLNDPGMNRGPAAGGPGG